MNKDAYIPDLWLIVTVHDQHKAKTVKSHVLPPRYYRQRGSNDRGFSRGNRGILAIFITVQTSSFDRKSVFNDTCSI